jgi:hypothetical protein
MSPKHSSTAPRPNQLSPRRYELLMPIAAGGMARVWAARASGWNIYVRKKADCQPKAGDLIEELCLVS